MDSFLIKKPWITERSTDLNQIGKYVFIVQPSATKSEVKKVVEKIYKVKVTAVNIVNRPHKHKRFMGKKNSGERMKKAIVTLKTGDKIDVR